MVTTTTTSSTTSDADDAVEHDAAPDSQFESYLDPVTGEWSLRRIPSTPPEADVTSKPA